nr:peroxisomal N(1)-acetyl-spermine/spermidine oxidase [Helicoverpa armigera]XP_021201087.2 peroxisomal N(1)-acetyl-spermine/spermidine oxidase [Helicoverpa armigera]XP_021201088.2 peroxisomal N(1)-acetyl-spermine/spermidine oxidase [Helicoverpa armigera]
MDVIVVGCGAAGISAMRKLHDAGLQVLGLEAADRIGGRICTVEFGGKPIDIGAAWCHGEKDNKVFEIANPLGLIGRSDPDTNFYLRSNGALVPEDEATGILKALDDEVGSANKYSKGSIAECVRNAANTNDALKKNPELSRSFIEWYERNNHLGGQDDPKTGKSLRGLVEFWNSDGDPFLNWKGRGYKTILDVLMNKYPDPSKEIPLQILLNKEVENIRWGITQLGIDPSNPLVQVKCKDGSLYAAKSVIVTLSVGVLKERHEQLFYPQLPQEKVTSIQNLNMCVLDKIYIEFEKPWWPKTPAKFTILWREEDKAKFTGKDQWVTEIFGLWTIDYQPNVLLAWIYGKGAEMMEKASVEEVQAGVKKLLDTMVTEFKVTPIKDLIRTKWASNKLARGAYAYRTVALEENGGSAIVLSEPLYHANKFPVVCFAGEATSHHRHSDAHGAVESGFREADRLIETFEEFGFK